MRWRIALACVYCVLGFFLAPVLVTALERLA